MDHLQGRFQTLDAAAQEVTTALKRANIRHGYIGGYATSVVGGIGRMTEDIDLIVDADPNVVQKLLLEADPQFRRTDKNSLVFETVDDSVPVELLRGGSGGVLRLPDPRTVSLLSVTAQDQPGRGIDKTPIPVVAPSILVLMKIRRWSFLADSTRPQSIQKAKRDVEDIKLLFTWLVKKNLRVDFEGYWDKPKEDLLPGVRKLYEMHAMLRHLIEAALEGEDFALISN